MRSRLFGGAAIALLLVGLGVPSALAARMKWVPAWNASPSDAGEALTDQTVRDVVTPLRAGSMVRVRLTNRFGMVPLRISHVTIAVRRTGAALTLGTVRTIRFAGKSAVNVPAGTDVASDRIRFDVKPFKTLAVSIALAGTVTAPTRHFGGRQTSFMTAPGAGDATTDTGSGAFTIQTRTRLLITGVDVEAARGTRSIVTVGDSITDGFQGYNSPVVENEAGVDRDARYPDFLARRLVGERIPAAVSNAGISGNRINSPGLAAFFGPSLLSRLNADVLRNPGVTDVVLLEGANDIGQTSGVTANDVIHGLDKALRQIKAKGLRAYIATLTPMRGTILETYGSPAADALRRQVNNWIRNKAPADGVIDFDAALRDPSANGQLQSRYDSTDHLHPSTAGYRRMAAAIPLSRFR